MHDRPDRGGTGHRPYRRDRGGARPQQPYRRGISAQPRADHRRRRRSRAGCRGDTSLAYTVEPIVRFVRAFGAHRVVFGSDLYSHPLGYTRSRVLADLREADLSAADKAAILAGTAETLLGLSPPARAPIPTPLPPNRPRGRPRPPTAPPRTTRP
ncbi:amidohydrolase family protein [Embleya sp. NPDC008237]|uniref:amidohydrolase family protein n=1 Tax=Embleya sp. NPDC008237 TaxID=3363978 RepID=UPI0036EEBEDC